MNEELVRLVVLCILYICYMLLGTILFMELEYENEQNQVKHFKDVFGNFHFKSNASMTDIKKLLGIFRDSYSLGIDPLVDHQSKWDMPGSFYFVGTVITTIGFGNTAPVTRLGQFCFIPYSLIGIPLNILLFNTLLDLTVQVITVFLRRCHRFWQAIRRRIAKQNSGSGNWEPTTASIAFVCMTSVTLIIMITAPLFLFLEEWTLFESVYFSTVAFTTVGFGDFVPSGEHSGSGQNVTPHYKIGNWIVIMIGMTFMYSTMAVMASIYKQILNSAVERCRKFIAKKRNRVLGAQTSSPSLENVRNGTGDKGEVSSEDTENVTARRVLSKWKSLKKAKSIGTINAVEASILKSRLSPNNQADQENECASPSFFMDAMSQASITERIDTLEDLDAVEAKLNRDYKQILNDIKQRRELIKSKSVTSDLSFMEDGIGITNNCVAGIAIRISSPTEETNEVFPYGATKLPSPPSTD